MLRTTNTQGQWEIYGQGEDFKRRLVELSKILILVIRSHGLAPWSVTDCLRGVGVTPEQDHGFSPHISLMYLAPGAKLKEEVEVHAMPLTFNEFVLCWADKQTKIKFGAKQ